MGFLDNAGVDRLWGHTKNLVDSIEIGGRNLIQGSKDFSSGVVHLKGYCDVSEKVGSFTVLKAKRPTNATFYDPIKHNVPYESNTTYTLSFYAKADTEYTIHSYFFNIGTDDWYENGDTPITLTTSWKRYTISWTTKESTRETAYVIPMRLMGDCDTWCYIYGVKMEKGTIPTDWTPAPEDPADYANSIRDRYNSKKTTIAYSQDAMQYSDFTYLAGWTGYELRAVDKALFATNEALKKAIEELKKYVDTQSPGGVTLGSVYPVGSIYISVNDSFNPNDVFPGTWVSFGKGRTLVGVDTSDPEFQSSEDTGGEKTHVLTVDELPEHNHDVTVENKELKGSVWNFAGQGATFGPGNSTSGVFSKGGDGTCFYPSSTGKATGVNDGFMLDATHDHTATSGNTGSGTAHNNMMPYITVRMWKRTA